MQHQERGWVEGRGEVLHCLDFLSLLASLLCRQMATTAFLSSTLLSCGIGSAFHASSMGNQASCLPVFRSFVHPFFMSCHAFTKKKKIHHMHTQPFYYYPLSSSATLSTLLLISCFMGITYVHALNLTCP